QRLLVEALAPVAPSSDGTLQWGSADRNSRFRIVQLLEGGLHGAAFVLKQGDNFVGRATGDVAFPQDGFVSSRHALLRAHGGLLMVRDLGSSNGTFIRLSGPTFVEDGDHFLIGRELFRVQIE
ncbi:MAG TPA: FHA domain-containing protein, partial [Myxococcales bacterium]